MESAHSQLIGFCTVPNQDVGINIAQKLVENSLVACVNIIPQLISIYKWKGKIEQDHELLCVMKTQRDRIPLIIETIKGMHPYECPEIIFFPIEAGYSEYLKWILNETSAK
jgi:periplasmic divalent cation tolerance protein